MFQKVKDWFAADQKRLIIGAVAVLAVGFFVAKKVMQARKFKQMSKRS
jgi:hypothetical protein